MGKEYELKFTAAPPDLAAVYTAYPGQWQTLHMQTVYYDTPGRTLSALRYTLRKRMENGLPICTLKTPGSNGSRGEWEVSCGSNEDAVPMLCKLLGSDELRLLTQAGLVPVCGAEFTRQAKEIVWQDSLLELALDEGILTGGNQTVPLCEIEVELKSGDPLAANAFATMLAETYHLTPEERSKFQRALSLSKGE